MVVDGVLACEGTALSTMAMAGGQPVLLLSFDVVYTQQGRLSSVAQQAHVRSFTLDDSDTFHASNVEEHAGGLAELAAASSPTGVHVLLSRGSPRALEYVSAGVTESVGAGAALSFGIASGGDGAPVVGYVQQGQYPSDSVWIARRSPAGGWTPSRLAEGTRYYLYGITVDHAGRAHASVSAGDSQWLDLVEGGGASPLPSDMRTVAMVSDSDRPYVASHTFCSESPCLARVHVPVGDGYRALDLAVPVVTKACPCQPAAYACTVDAPKIGAMRLVETPGHLWLVYNFIEEIIDEELSAATTLGSLGDTCSVVLSANRSRGFLVVAEVAPDRSAIRQRWKIETDMAPQEASARGARLVLSGRRAIAGGGGVGYTEIDTTRLPP